MEPKPPKMFDEFTARFPQHAKAWELLNQGAEEAGPLDSRTMRLVKLAIAVGAQREGSTHSSVRKALSMGITREEIEQVIAAASGTIGLPPTVAAWAWARDVLEKK
jgi:alkylhydroperoxidase/carboxymuconolactone decarboxylase family protein YurZ